MQATPLYFPPNCVTSLNPLIMRLSREAIVNACRGAHKDAVLVFDEDQDRALPIRTLKGVAETALADALELREVHDDTPDAPQHGFSVRPLGGSLYSRQFINFVQWGYKAPQHPLRFGTPPPPSTANPWLQKACRRIPATKYYPERDNLIFAFPFGNLATDGIRMHADENLAFDPLPQAYAQALATHFSDDEAEAARLTQRAAFYTDSMKRIMEEVKNLSPRLYYPRPLLETTLKSFKKDGQIAWTMDGNTTTFSSETYDSASSLPVTRTATLTHLGHHFRHTFYINPQFVLDALAGMKPPKGQPDEVLLRFNENLVVFNAPTLARWAVIHQIYNNA